MVNMKKHEACTYAENQEQQDLLQEFLHDQQKQIRSQFALCAFPAFQCKIYSSLLPVQQSMVKVFTEALQDPVVISDGWGLIFTGCKVTLQL